MRISIAQQNYTIGDVEGNTTSILEAIASAKAQGADLIVFSELAICGYPPQDLLYNQDLLDACYQGVDRIAKAARGISVLVGTPTYNNEATGKRLYNSVCYLNDGKIEQVVHKTLLPSYDIFDETRYFEPGSDWRVIECKGHKLAVTICEDIWGLGPDSFYHRLPLDILCKQEAQLIINLSASPFDYTHSATRKAVILDNVQRYKLPIVYCNAVGAQTGILFDGGSLAMDAHGQVITKCRFFQEDSFMVEWDGVSELKALSPMEDPDTMVSYPSAPGLVADYNVRSIHDGLILGIRDYFRKMGFRKALVSSSGGLDSAVVLALACEALGAENVQALLLPSPYSSTHSVEDAVRLSDTLGNPYEILPIHQVFETAGNALRPLFLSDDMGLAGENLQSRIRGLLVMGYSNRFGHVLLNTSNKSELATGYGTLYGDMAGGLSVIGDLYKTQVYALARYINKDQERIPRAILEKPPSAELSPGQKDTDTLPPYEDLDAILYRFIEGKLSLREIKGMGHDPIWVDRIISMVNKNEFKRAQFCPILRVSTHCFGAGRRMPIVAKYPF